MGTSVISHINRTCDVKATKGVGSHCFAVNEEETIPLCEDALMDELLKMGCLSFVQRGVGLGVLGCCACERRLNAWF